MRQLGMLSLRYLTTSAVAPGQLVSSSSSRPRSWISPVSPPEVSKLHPVGDKQRHVVRKPYSRWIKHGSKYMKTVSSAHVQQTCELLTLGFGFVACKMNTVEQCQIKQGKTWNTHAMVKQIFSLGCSCHDPRIKTGKVQNMKESCTPSSIRKFRCPERILFLKENCCVRTHKRTEEGSPQGIRPAIPGSTQPCSETVVTATDRLFSCILEAHALHTQISQGQCSQVQNPALKDTTQKALT